MNANHERNTHRLKCFTTFVTLIVAMFCACNLSAQKVGDGICKNVPIPPGLVPIQEMTSIECPLNDQFEKNAWILGDIKDGIESCVPPDLATDPAGNIRYVVCSTKINKNCPIKSDGTDNAYVLKEPLHCLDRYMYKCRAGLTASFWIDHAKAFWQLVMFVHTDSCGKGTDVNAGLVTHLGQGQLIAACDYGIPAFAYGYSSPITSDPEAGGSTITNDYVLPIRRFHNPDCDRASTVGSDRFGINKGLNAIVYSRFTFTKDGPPLPGSIVMCKQDSTPDIARLFHDDRCGIENGMNALYLRPYFR